MRALTRGQMTPEQTTKCFKGRAHSRGCPGLGLAQGWAHSSAQPRRAVLSPDARALSVGPRCAGRPRHRPAAAPSVRGAGAVRLGSERASGRVGSGIPHRLLSRSGRDGRPVAAVFREPQRSTGRRCGMRQRSKRRGTRTRGHAPRLRSSRSASSQGRRRLPPQPGPHRSSPQSGPGAGGCRYGGSPRARRSGVRVPRPPRGCTASAAPSRPSQELRAGNTRRAATSRARGRSPPSPSPREPPRAVRARPRALTPTPRARPRRRRAPSP